MTPVASQRPDFPCYLAPKMAAVGRRESSSNSSKTKKILTVGDGDLSLSLAIHRAYGRLSRVGNNDGDDDGGNTAIDAPAVKVTASVLETDHEELLRTYPDTADCLKELEEQDVNVHFGVDATQLHRYRDLFSKHDNACDDDNIFSLVSFHHPHLGLASLLSGDEEAEAVHAERHHRLLCHYFYSASRIAKTVHVCLCGTQPDTWRILDAASKQNLELVRTLRTAAPFSLLWCEDHNDENGDVGVGNDSHIPAGKGSDNHGRGRVIDQANPALPHFTVARRYRNGKLGSRHFLGKYGYRHRRTEGQRYNGSSADCSVHGSVHFLFRKSRSGEASLAGPQTTAKQENRSSSSHHGREQIPLSPAQPSSHSLATSTAISFACEICNAEFQSLARLAEHHQTPARPEVALTSIQDVKHVHVADLQRKNNANSSRKIYDSEGSRLRTSTSTDARHNPTMLLPSKIAAPSKAMNVPDDCVGKRLKWFIHKHIDGLAKRRAESMIRAGSVRINEVAVVDSGRILKTGDTVSIGIASLLSTSAESGVPPTNIQVEFRCEAADSSLVSSARYVVVWKPSGMRTKGRFSGTLEDVISIQEKERYTCISHGIETSMYGLCVLSCRSTNDHTEICHELGSLVRHTLTALVHGRVGKDWWPSRKASLEINSKWRAKRRRKGPIQDEDGATHDSQPVKTFDIEIVPKETSFLEAPTGGQENINVEIHQGTTLSTVEIITSHPSTSSICHFLRQAGHPVVGDSYSSKEYLSLRRSIRNRIKDKLCMGCFKVELLLLSERNQTGDSEKKQDGKVVERPVPDKLSARFWSKFENAMEPPIKR